MRQLVISPDLYGGDSLSLKDPFIRILMTLPPAAAAFYCQPEYARNHPELLEALRGRGLSVHLQTRAVLGANSVLLSDLRSKVLAKDPLAEFKKAGGKVLYYVNSTEETNLIPSADEFFIYTSELQLVSCLPGREFCLGEDETIEVGLSPEGGQGVAVGLLRADDLREGLDGDKKVLRARLAELMGADINPDLPLALHFLAHQNILADVDRGLSRLGEKVGVVIKNLDWHPGLELFKSQAAGPNVFIYRRRSQADNQLMRTAADVVLPGCFSGFFSTSLMMGLRVIPVYTQHIFIHAKAYRRNERKSFSSVLRERHKMIPMKIMDFLTPICVEATEMLVARILDQDYWQLYQRELPVIQRSVFGRYLLGEAAVQRALSFIVRLLQTGSFVSPGSPGSVTVRDPFWVSGLTRL